MKQRIFKYEIMLTGSGEISIDIPLGAKFLSVGVQRDKLVAWFLVPAEPALPIKQFGFYLVQTGQTISSISLDDLIFCGTYLFHDGGFVLHVWRDKETL